MSFKDTYGGRKVSAMQRTQVGYMRGVIARKLKMAAESEIQLILGEVEARIRKAIAQDIEVRLGELDSYMDGSSMNEKLLIHVHVNSRKPAGNAPVINISDPHGGLHD